MNDVDYTRFGSTELNCLTRFAFFSSIFRYKFESKRTPVHLRGACICGYPSAYTFLYYNEIRKHSGLVPISDRGKKMYNFIVGFVNDSENFMANFQFIGRRTSAVKHIFVWKRMNINRNQ